GRNSAAVSPGPASVRSKGALETSRRETGCRDCAPPARDGSARRRRASAPAPPAPSPQRLTRWRRRRHSRSRSCGRLDRFAVEDERLQRRLGLDPPFVPLAAAVIGKAPRLRIALAVVV